MPVPWPTCLFHQLCGCLSQGVLGWFFTGKPLTRASGGIESGSRDPASSFGVPGIGHGLLSWRADVKTSGWAENLLVPFCIEISKVSLELPAP